MRRMIWAGLALQLCAAPGLAQIGFVQTGFAQSVPTTTPGTPPVTTPPPPAEHPPTGGPNSLPTAEPANVIDKSAVNPSAGRPGPTAPSKGANSFTEAQARSRLQEHGYNTVSGLTKDQDGIWRGSAVHNGAPVKVSVDYKGVISTN